MASHGEDEDVIDYMDNGQKHDYEENDLEGMGKTSTEVLNIDPIYKPDWSPEEAFREFYQNAKDAMMKSFAIDELDFKIETLHSMDEYIWAFRSKKDPMKLLGYLKFSHDKAGYGHYELVNFKAKFQRRYLGFGGTTKADDPTQVGQHGEGVLLAGLVVIRHPHRFSAELIGSSCRWPFGWTPHKKMKCAIQRLPTVQLLEEKETARLRDAEGKPREFAIRPWDDVAVIVGKRRTCRSFTGEIQRTNEIHVDDFLEMIKETLDLDPPMKMITTPHGDLLLDTEKKDTVYLRGYRLQFGSSSGKTYEYGYNLKEGSTNRDRDMIMRPDEEAKQIALIWQWCLLEQPDETMRPGLIVAIHDILRNKFHDAADIHNIQNHMTKDVASLIWKNMLEVQKDKNGRSPFYYNADASGEGVEIIKRSLKRQPLRIPAGLWKIFEKFGLINTPKQECLRLFRQASLVALLNTSFANNVSHALRALLALEKSTTAIKMVPVDAKDLGMVVKYREGVLKVDDSWFVCESTGKSTYEDTAQQEDDIVLFLWSEIIIELQSEQAANVNMRCERDMKRMARLKLQQIPRYIRAMTNNARSELIVLWTSIEPIKNTDESIRITLHSADCKAETTWPEVLLYSKPPADPKKECSCLTQVCTVGKGIVTFKKVTSFGKYFPMISRDENHAIYGALKAPLSPANVEIVPERTYKRNESEAELPSFAGIPKLFTRTSMNVWDPLSYDDFVKLGFPYHHTWISHKLNGSEILIGKSKSDNFKAELKRVLSEECLEQSSKKPRK